MAGRSRADQGPTDAERGLWLGRSVARTFASTDGLCHPEGRARVAERLRVAQDAERDAGLRRAQLVRDRCVRDDGVDDLLLPDFEGLLLFRSGERRVWPERRAPGPQPGAWRPRWPHRRAARRAVCRPSASRTIEGAIE